MGDDDMEKCKRLYNTWVRNESSKLEEGFSGERAFLPRPKREGIQG